MIFGSFRSFQNFEPKILKKIQVTLITSNNQTMHFFHGLLIFLRQPTCGTLGSGNGLKSIRSSCADHLGSISGVLDPFRGLWRAPKPKLGHLYNCSRRILVKRYRQSEFWCYVPHGKERSYNKNENSFKTSEPRSMRNWIF